MIRLLLILIFLSLAKLAVRSVNPVKMRITLIIIARILIGKLYLLKGIAWFSCIIYLLFVGGILMMFIILSSLMPNQKPKKIKKFSLFIKTIISALILFWPPEHQRWGLNLMWQLRNNVAIGLALALVSAYFFFFIFLISKRKSSIKSTQCFYKLIL